MFPGHVGTHMAVEVGSVDDADAVADLWVSLASEQTQHGSHVCPGSNRALIRDRVARYAATDRLLVVREDGVVGFVLFDVQDGAYTLDVVRGVVEAIYVVPGHRGRGVGGELLAEAERRLRRRGADVVTLEALADNEAARRFYRRHGYRCHRVEFEKPLESDSHSKEDG